MEPLPEILTVNYHPRKGDDWGPDSYRKIYDLISLKDFSMFVSILQILDFAESGFYLTTPGYIPTWENNKGAGICSFSVLKKFGCKLIEDVMTRTVAKTYKDSERVFCYALTANDRYIMIKIWYNNFAEVFTPPEELTSQLRRASVMYKDCSPKGKYS